MSEISDFFKILNTEQKTIIKISNLANQLANGNGLSVQENLHNLIETAGLYQKIQYWANEAARQKNNVIDLIDYRDAIMIKLEAADAQNRRWVKSYKRLSTSIKTLQIAFKGVNDDNDKLNSENAAYFRENNLLNIANDQLLKKVDDLKINIRHNQGI